MKLGLCCILSNPRPNQKVNRRFNKYEHFLLDRKDGLHQTSQKILDNLDGTLNVIKYCQENDILHYRMSSSMFPNIGEYKISQLPDVDQIIEKFNLIGDFLDDNGMSFSFHPDHFVKLASPDITTLTQSLNNIIVHGNIVKLITSGRNINSHINIHIGGSYGDKNETVSRLIFRLKQFPPKLLDLIAFENDDKEGGYNVWELLPLYQETGVKITYDDFHHRCVFGVNDSRYEAFELAKKTWEDQPQVIHYSSSRQIYEENWVRKEAHADYIYQEIPFQDVVVELEAKKKEQAIFQYRNQFTEINL